MGIAWTLALVAALALVWWLTRPLRRAEAEARGEARADEALLFGMVLTVAGGGFAYFTLQTRRRIQPAAAPAAASGASAPAQAKPAAKK